MCPAAWPLSAPPGPAALDVALLLLVGAASLHAAPAAAAVLAHVQEEPAAALAALKPFERLARQQLDGTVGERPQRRLELARVCPPAPRVARSGWHELGLPKRDLIGLAQRPQDVVGRAIALRERAEDALEKRA